jgi:hypothetical protein
VELVRGLHSDPFRDELHDDGPSVLVRLVGTVSSRRRPAAFGERGRQRLPAGSCTAAIVGVITCQLGGLQGLRDGQPRQVAAVAASYVNSEHERSSAAIRPESVVADGQIAQQHGQTCGRG